MKKRLRNKNPQAYRLLLIPLFITAIAFMLFRVPPQNYFVIVGFATLVTLLAFTAGSFVLRPRDNQLLSLFILLFMATTIVAGFNLINTILLLSFIIGLKLLLVSPSKGAKQDPST